MSRPPHSDEHNDLLVILAKQVETSKLIDGVILITVGVDGRPCVGANIANPGFVLQLMRELGEAGDQVETVRKVDIPGTN